MTEFNRRTFLETMAVIAPASALPWQQDLPEDPFWRRLKEQRQLVDYLTALDDDHFRQLVFVVSDRKAHPENHEALLQTIMDTGTGFPEDMAEMMACEVRRIDFEVSLEKARIPANAST